MAKFDWGRALISAGGSLQNYFMQQDAERRRQEDIARRQQEIQAQRLFTLTRDQDARNERVRAQNLRDPFVAAPQEFVDKYPGFAYDPAVPSALGGGLFGPNVGPQKTGQMIRRSELWDFMNQKPDERVEVYYNGKRYLVHPSTALAHARATTPAPEEPVIKLGAPSPVPGMDGYVGQLNPETEKWENVRRAVEDEPAPAPLADFAPIPGMPGYSGQLDTITNEWTNIKKDVKDGVPSLDPSWIDAYNNPRYSNFGPGQELAFLLRDASTDFTNPSGGIDWERETVEPFHINDIDEYKNGVFKDTGLFGQGELGLDEVKAKVAEAIAGAADKGMVYAGIVKDLESRGVPQDVLNKVMPEFDGWDLDELRELIKTPPPPPREALEAAPGARRRWAKGDNGFEWQFYIGDKWTRWE